MILDYILIFLVHQLYHIKSKNIIISYYFVNINIIQLNTKDDLQLLGMVLYSVKRLLRYNAQSRGHSQKRYLR